MSFMLQELFHIKKLVQQRIWGEECQILLLYDFPSFSIYPTKTILKLHWPSFTTFIIIGNTNFVGKKALCISN